MRFLLKLVVGFTIGRFMSVINQVGYLNILPSVIIALIGTIVACVLIDFGFREDTEQ